jgi:alkylation response protein AidB-like acyl-CoA dehydrogenase
MDFKFTPEQEALRREFEDFFEEEAKNAPPGWGGSLEDAYNTDEGWDYIHGVAKKLGAKGWLVRAWPKEYGGQDAPIIEQLIFSDVTGYYGLMIAVDPFGCGMLGPTLLAVGNEEQKREHLPPIAKAEKVWCQLWSEPNAGSDLASLTTTAKREGDYYILNGQKTWITGAHRADWGFGVFRTDPTQKRSRGLSFILLDLKTPGVTVNPIPGMSGSTYYNEVFFDNVKVPVKNRVSEENKGWDVTRAAMNFERSGVGFFSAARRQLEDLIKFCKETKRNGKPLADDPLVRGKLADMAIDIEVGTALAYQIAWIQERGGGMAAMLQAAPLASASKVFGTESAQRLTYSALEILGLYGPVKPGSKWAKLLGLHEAMYQFNPAMNIFAGSSEIQRNTIAWLGLGLPRSWDEVFKR